MKPLIPAALCTSLSLLSCSHPERNKQLPNIVYILADDLGYGDLSCYGQARYTTPSLDRLASRGMKFRMHYTGCTVSAPSRSCLMTGLHSGHTPIRGNKNWNPEGNWPLPGPSVTIAEMLKTRGYTTGAFGKWGLGYIDTEGDPNAQGFDEFYGYNCQTLAHNYYPDHLWHNHEKIILHENEGARNGSYSRILFTEKLLNLSKRTGQSPSSSFIPQHFLMLSFLPKKNI
ncbi:MAG TPA: sulfatase-like hydrolase/transferase [Bacteroidales bacterium]|nr:sulfatase-like hydrolase/transferase [Bacteroidales bacterium]